MISYARQNPEQQPDVTPPPADDHIAPAPRVSVQAFCETVETAAAVQSAGEDRRLGKAHLKIQMGGMAAAIEAYRTAPTPNVIILETEGRSDILAGLDQLATVCDSGTRVVVIGRVNDVTLYRELVRRGVSDYVIAPVNTLDVVRSICGLFSAPEAKGRRPDHRDRRGQRAASAHPPSPTTSPGRSRAISRWIPWSPISISRSAPPASTTIRTLRRASPMRYSRPIASIPRSSTVCCRNAPTISACWRRRRRWSGSTTSAPTRSTRSSTRFAPRCRASCSTFPINGRDGPTRALVGADDILIVAAPDLANLRNTKNIFDLLKASRPNDRTPLYCLNQVGVPKRPEINASEFAKAIESQPIAAIPFDPQMFGSAANNGQMIAEISANHRTTEMFLQIAQRLTGRGETKKPRGSFLSPLIEKLRAK